MSYLDFAYLTFINLALCVCYFLFIFLFSKFFEQKEKTKIYSKRTLFSLLLITVLSWVIYFISYSFSNLEMGNRFLHALGGGFMSVVVCYLAVRNNKFSLTRFQFFVFSFMLVSTMGVANELLEFFLQSYFHLPAASTITDTWLDLLSNTVGILIASLVCVL